jgi:hypothetical protein
MQWVQLKHIAQSSENLQYQWQFYIKGSSYSKLYYAFVASQGSCNISKAQTGHVEILGLIDNKTLYGKGA